MGIVTEMLTTLGANLPLVAVGCAEVLAAAALLGRAAVMRTQSGKNRASLAPVGMNRDIQRVLRLESGEVMLVLRREDMMLLACTGDPEKLLGVSYAALRDNIANLNAAFSDKSRCRAVWKKYMAWDGREMFDEDVQSGGGRSSSARPMGASTCCASATSLHCTTASRNAKSASQGRRRRAARKQPSSRVCRTRSEPR